MSLCVEFASVSALLLAPAKSDAACLQIMISMGVTPESTGIGTSPPTTDGSLTEPHISLLLTKADASANLSPMRRGRVVVAGLVVGVITIVAALSIYAFKLQRELDRVQDDVDRHVHSYCYGLRRDLRTAADQYAKLNIEGLDEGQRERAEGALNRTVLGHSYATRRIASLALLKAFYFCTSMRCKGNDALQDRFNIISGTFAEHGDGSSVKNHGPDESNRLARELADAADEMMSESCNSKKQ